MTQGASVLRHDWMASLYDSSGTPRSFHANVGTLFPQERAGTKHARRPDVGLGIAFANAQKHRIRLREALDSPFLCTSGNATLGFLSARLRGNCPCTSGSLGFCASPSVIIDSHEHHDCIGGRARCRPTPRRAPRLSPAGKPAPSTMLPGKRRSVQKEADRQEDRSLRAHHVSDTLHTPVAALRSLHKTHSSLRGCIRHTCLWNHP